MLIEERIDCPHTLRVLHRARIATMEELAALTKEDLLALRGVGKVIASSLGAVVEEWKSGQERKPPA